MKNFIIFFSIVLIVFGAVNYYIFIRGLQAIPKGNPFRNIYIILFSFAAASYFAGRILDRVSVNVISEGLIWLGSFWMAFMVYFILALVLLDILRLINHFIPFFPQLIVKNYAAAKFTTACVVTAIVTVVVLAGHYNASHPKVTKLSFNIDKDAGNLKTLRIAAASDIHLGTMIRNSRIDLLVDSINAMKPDIVLLPGDIVDEELAPVIKLNLGEAFTRIKSKYGVFAVTGNHEYIGGAEAAVKYLRAHNVNFLRDSVIKIDNAFYVAGREDYSLGVFTGGKRKKIGEIIEGIDKNLPVIIMDHQPFHLEEAEHNGIDFQLSGHTHHGQLWPFGYLTEKIYELSWGYKIKGNTHIYVSSGFGGWGPPVRTGNHPEILCIDLSFK